MPGGPCAQPGEPRGPPVTQRGAGAGSARPRGFLHSPQLLSAIKAAHRPLRSSTPLRHPRHPLLSRLRTPASASARHGPQLLLHRRRILHVCRLLQMQRLQVRLLQEELLLLLPRGLCQVCPGLRLQRRLRQVQLLRLKAGRTCSPV